MALLSLLLRRLGVQADEPFEALEETVLGRRALLGLQARG